MVPDSSCADNGAYTCVSVQHYCQSQSAALATTYLVWPLTHNHLHVLHFLVPAASRRVVTITETSSGSRTSLSDLIWDGCAADPIEISSIYGRRSSTLISSSGDLGPSLCYSSEPGHRKTAEKLAGTDEPQASSKASSTHARSNRASVEMPVTPARCTRASMDLPGTHARSTRASIDLSGSHAGFSRDSLDMAASQGRCRSGRATVDITQQHPSHHTNSAAYGPSLAARSISPAATYLEGSEVAGSRARRNNVAIMQDHTKTQHQLGFSSEPGGTAAGSAAHQVNTAHGSSRRGSVDVQHQHQQQWEQEHGTAAADRQDARSSRGARGSHGHSRRASFLLPGESLSKPGTITATAAVARSTSTEHRPAHGGKSRRNSMVMLHESHSRTTAATATATAFAAAAARSASPEIRSRGSSKSRRNTAVIPPLNLQQAGIQAAAPSAAAVAAAEAAWDAEQHQAHIGLRHDRRPKSLDTLWQQANAPAASTAGAARNGRSASDVPRTSKSLELPKNSYSSGEQAYSAASLAAVGRHNSSELPSCSVDGGAGRKAAPPSSAAAPSSSAGVAVRAGKAKMLSYLLNDAEDTYPLQKSKSTPITTISSRPATHKLKRSKTGYEEESSSSTIRFFSSSEAGSRSGSGFWPSGLDLKSFKRYVPQISKIDERALQRVCDSDSASYVSLLDKGIYQSLQRM